MYELVTTLLYVSLSSTTKSEGLVQSHQTIVEEHHDISQFCAGVVVKQNSI